MRRTLMFQITAKGRVFPVSISQESRGGQVTATVWDSQSGEQMQSPLKPDMTNGQLAAELYFLIDQILDQLQAKVAVKH